ncbi:Ribosomal protein L30, bacterial-type [Heracleum sosnowskyi]|uniref:Large ribosomal subunit protein uL30m n=1 Tax=Heracleum sosnowskyi TaxID=360622 RepID=A0AAD8N630_9APIA|nr:Ribosomal protein L30, bacterial-type [Heracleum sosnowskyi]
MILMKAKLPQKLDKLLVLVCLKPSLSPKFNKTTISTSTSVQVKETNNMLNAFKAYKACVPIAWSPNLYITLVRGIPGTRRLHRRTLEALRLRKCNRTVMRWNTPTVRGMLQQVKRLVVIETEEMYKARKQKIADHQAIRPPIVVNHSPTPASGSA